MSIAFHPPDHWKTIPVHCPTCNRVNFLSQAKPKTWCECGKVINLPNLQKVGFK